MNNKLILDMVHHNPGEPRFDSRFNDPALLRQMGYNGKVYSLFESPVLAVDWNGVEPDTTSGEAETWRQELFVRIKREFARCKENHLSVFAMSDLMIFPRGLVEKAGMSERFGDISEPWVREHLKILIDLVFTQFPELDGLIVRIGETYLHDAPYHAGAVTEKSNVRKTIIPLLQLLREEMCVKRGKTLIFRTWGSFDENLTAYMIVSDAVQPHPNLVISVKHCEDDFHRGNPFSKIIGFGQHQQLIEIQCAREYEGKGAYPNYVAHGVINGFEEHAANRFLHSIGEFARFQPEKFAGIWTWTRGGGWEGPYIKDEFWPDLNAFVLARWVQNPSVAEEAVFAACCREKLHLDLLQTQELRELCLASEKAIVRGKASLLGYFPPWWTRDQYIGVPPQIPFNRELFFQEKRESVLLWEKIVSISVKFGGYIETSSCYGLYLYRIYEAVWHVALGDNDEYWHHQYGKAWEDLENLSRNRPDCATLYERNHVRRLVNPLPADALMTKNNSENKQGEK